ncbi:MAG: RluA family pseudouridine synthase [Cytophagaceae bacterium]|nr:RluA family pseudouridine synthase [Cytophagaceae bacterium]
MEIKNSRPKTSSNKKPDTRLTVTEEAELMAFLLAKLPHKSRNNIKTLLRDKQIFVDDQVVTQYNHPLKPDQKVNVRWDKPPEEQHYRGLSIVFEDDYLIVINKQEGLLSIATTKEKIHTAYSILSDHIKKQDPKNRLFIVHRLDRETSGLMLFAKSERIQKLLQESWGTTTKERTYLAVTEGPVERPEGVISSYLHESKALIVYSDQNSYNGQRAITHYETLKSNGYYSLLKVSLETGRKNQVRVHMQDIGHPIVGDAKYGATIDPIGRLGLHAWVLAFAHPVTREQLRFETPIPVKFSGLF